jgi:hypothetical protein
MRFHLLQCLDIPSGMLKSFDETNETPWAEVAQGGTRLHL